MKVLQVLSKSSGGIRQHVSALYFELEARGVSSKIVGPTGVMDGLCEQHGEFSLSTIKHPFSIVQALRVVRRESREVDLIHAHGATVALISVFSQAFEIRKVPIVLTLHNVIGPNKTGVRRKLSLAFENFIFRKVDRVICPSKNAFSQYKLKSDLKNKFSVLLPVSKVIPKAMRSEVIEKREDTRRRYGLGKTDVVLCCVARINPQKNLDVLLSCFSLVVQHVPKARLVIAGNGLDEYVDKMKQLVNDLGLEDVVTFIGYLHEPEELIAASDLFVLSSSSETVPLVLLESLSLQVPVVMTNTGIASEVLDGQCGSYAPIGDAKELANQIVRWCTYIDEGTISRDKLEETADRWLDSDARVLPLMDIYKSVINS